MRVAIGFAAILAVSATGARADEKTPIMLEPSSPWQVNYSDDSCRLARIFGEGEERSVFIIDRYEPGDAFYLVVAGKLIEARGNVASRFEFGPGGLVRDDERQSGELGEFGASTMASDMRLLPTEEAEDSEKERRRFDLKKEAQDTDVFGQLLSAQQEASIEWLEVRRGNRRPVRFALGSMRAPMAAMRKCTDELLTHWGIDLEAHRGLTRAAVPKSNPGNWITSRDYPTDLLRKGAQGLVQFRLSVSPEGKPTQCHIQQSTRPEGFDKAVCDTLMRRGQFEPALGADGQPIASFWRSAVRFQMFK